MVDRAAGPFLKWVGGKRQLLPRILGFLPQRVDTYYEPFRAAERDVVGRLMAGHRHVFESEMKERERTRGVPHHEAVPDDGGPQSGPPR